MSFHSSQISREEAIEVAQYAIDNFLVCSDVLGSNTHSKIIKTLGLSRDSVVLNIGAGAYNQQSPDTLIQVLPPTNLIVCDIEANRLNTWKIFWDSEFLYEDGSVTPIVADARNLPLPDSCVDLVYSANLINDPNFTRQANAIEEFLVETKRVLKSGGTVFLNSFGYLVGDTYSGNYCFRV